jgi:V/A-type H+-transporting ATPase subunit C
MNGITRHGAAQAKAHSLMGKLLKDDDYRQLMQTTNIRNFVDYLVKNTVYQDVFPEPDKIIHRLEIEIGMGRNLFKNFEKFYHYYYDNYRTFFKILFMRYEVENLKLIIRAITRQETIRHLGEYMITSQIFSYVEYDQVLKARNISEFVDALEGTPYYSVIRAYTDESGKKMQFYMEMNLDRLYFKRLKEGVSQFRGKDHQLMTEVLGKNSDLLNIQWIYRAKKFYHLSPEEILNYTLITGQRYDYKKLKQLCYLQNVEEIKTQIASSEYGILFQDDDILMERNMERYLYNLMNELLRIGNHSIIVPVVFMHKLEYEVRDLFTILECIKYGITDIEKFLVRRLVRG